jgi:RNA polymerase sigma-70 factor (ECF subfamily)
VTVVAAEARAVGAAVALEPALIERARAMEPAAWDELYSLHYPAIFRYCAYRIAEPEAAEDIAADVFVEAVRGIGRFRYRGRPFRAWLYRIAHNLTVDEHKRRARAGGARVEFEAVNEPCGPDFASGVLDRRALQVALATLTEDQQQVVILRFLEGLSLKEVADVMRRPVGAVKALQFRAVSRLRAELGGEVD